MVAEVAAPVATFEEHLGPIREVASSPYTEHSTQLEETTRPILAGSKIFKIIIIDILVAMFDRG